MSNPLTMKSWSPYAVGVGIGVLSWFAFATADHPLGITTAFEHTAALAGQAAAPAEADGHPYYAEQEAKGKPPKIGWGWMLVAGVFLGALISARLSGDRGAEDVPALWRWRFGDSKAVRFLGAFLAAGLMIFGARLAKGCTSGHAISGALQLAVSSWAFAAVMFLAAIATAFLVYGKEGANHV